MHPVAGYSGTPLAKKLGIVEGTRVAIVSAPDGFCDELDVPDGVHVRTAARGRLDVLVFFVTRRGELTRRFPTMKRALEYDGGLWIAWPKRTSGVATDLSENPVREIGFANGLVDNKVAAIDDTWSGLRFVYRRADRPGRCPPGERGSDGHNRDVCGRFVTASSPALIADRFAVDEVDASVAAIPSPTTTSAPAGTSWSCAGATSDQRVLSRLRWGLVPSWAKDVKIGDRMINARAETVASKPAYRRAFAKKRCLIPADGFYEWKAGPADRASDAEAPEAAVLHPPPRRRAAGVRRACGRCGRFPTTCRPDLGGDDGWLRVVRHRHHRRRTSSMAPIHNRMPVILPESAWEQWLDPDEHDVDALVEVARPARRRVARGVSGEHEREQRAEQRAGARAPS